MRDLVPISVAGLDAREMAAAIEEAERTGDMSPVWTIIKTLLTESPGWARQPRLPRDHLLALALFTLSMDAGHAADEASQTLFLRTMREHCSRKAINSAVTGSLLGTAARQGGWLDGPVYDDLAARISQLPDDHPARAMFAMVQRRPATRPTGHRRERTAQ
jgi:hypothetical protein